MNFSGTAIQAVNLLQEIIKSGALSKEEYRLLLDEALEITSQFPKELEKHDREVLYQKEYKG